jgi:ATP-dependent DNA ligase
MWDDADTHYQVQRSAGSKSPSLRWNPSPDLWRRLPLLQRKRRLAKLLGKSQRRAIRFVEHLTGDGPTIFDHVCRLGLEGIVSKRVDSPHRSGLSKVWLKSKNPASEAVRREREEGGAR